MTSGMDSSLQLAAGVENTLENKMQRVYEVALDNVSFTDNRRTSAMLREKLSQPVIVQQSIILCEDYIYGKLHQKESNPIKPTTTTSTTSSANSDHLTGLRSPSDVSLEIQRLGRMLESKHPDLYCNLPRQIMMPLRSDVAVRKALVCIGDYMFKNCVVTWGRIVGLFAVAGAIAAECVEGGHSQHIRVLVTTFSELIDRHASRWIYRQGGWVRIITAFRTVKEVRGMWALTIVGALLGLLVTWSIQSSQSQPTLRESELASLCLFDHHDC